MGHVQVRADAHDILEKGYIQGLYEKRHNAGGSCPLASKEEKSKNKIEIRRNKAYFQHRKYRSRIEWAEATKDDFSPYEKHKLSNKYDKQTNTWKTLNQQLKKGIINIRPTNKAIAKALGMCERQISFYIKNAYLLGLKL